MRYFLLLFLLSMAVVFVNGCATRTIREYHPPTKDFYVEIELEDGTKEIRGALKSEKTESTPDLGTKGLGEYNFIPLKIGVN